MPLYIEKVPITIVGMGFPMFIGNMYAHRLIDDDTSRIMLLSTVGAELNTLQHFGHNSRKITIRGRINLTTGDTANSRAHPIASGFFGSVEPILTGLRMLKESKSAVLVIMNHGLCYGVINKITLVDDSEYPTSFDYDTEIIEKDLYGLKFSAATQRILSGLIAQVQTSLNRTRFVEPDVVIPAIVDEG